MDDPELREAIARLRTRPLEPRDLEPEMTTAEKFAQQLTSGEVDWRAVRLAAPMVLDSLDGEWHGYGFSDGSVLCETNNGTYISVRDFFLKKPA